MSHQQHGKPGARTWRDARAQAVKEGHLNEARVAAHKRRLLAEQRAFAARQEGDEHDDA